MVMMQQLYVGSGPLFTRTSSITGVRQLGCYTRRPIQSHTALSYVTKYARVAELLLTLQGKLPYSAGLDDDSPASRRLRMNAVYGFDGYVVSSPAIAARKGCSTLKSRCGGSGSFGAPTAFSSGREPTVFWEGRRSPIAQTRSEYAAARSCSLRTSDRSTAPVDEGYPLVTASRSKSSGKWASPRLRAVDAPRRNADRVMNSTTAGAFSKYSHTSTRSLGITSVGDIS